MKYPQGVLVRDSLFIGGGYTKSVENDTKIYMYKISLGSWVSLPPPPHTVKLSGFTTLGNKLVMLGGKETRRRSDDPGNEYVYSNQVSLWNLEEECWESNTLPGMTAGRALPVVFTHANYLIAGGGHRGVLENQVEILDISTMQWIQGPDLPIQCYQRNSTVVRGIWYLLDKCLGVIYYTDLETYIEYALGKHSGTTEDLTLVKWLKLPKLTASPHTAKPFRLTSLGSQLVTFIEIYNRPVMYFLQNDNTWSMVLGQILPLTTPTALVLSTNDHVLVMGGKRSLFSAKTFLVSMIQNKQMETGDHPEATVQEACGPEEDEPSEAVAVSKF